MEFNFLTGRQNNKLIDYNGSLIHEEALASFKELQLKAKQEIGADLQILSSFRDYDRQEMIWNAKASGERKLLDSNGTPLNYAELSNEEVLLSILRWSAIPGASRHHWGCDFDVFDSNKMNKEDVMLVPSESDIGAPMHELYEWIGKKIKEDDSCSFFRPYDEDFGGVNIEKWHISYKPTTDAIFESYTFDFFIKNLESSSILLKELILKDAKNIYNLYLKTISKP
jgi:hypothetical protein